MSRVCQEVSGILKNFVFDHFCCCCKGDKFIRSIVTVEHALKITTDKV